MRFLYYQQPKHCNKNKKKITGHQLTLISSPCGVFTLFCYSRKTRILAEFFICITWTYHVNFYLVWRKSRIFLMLRLNNLRARWIHGQMIKTLIYLSLGLYGSTRHELHSSAISFWPPYWEQWPRPRLFAR